MELTFTLDKLPAFIFDFLRDMEKLASLALLDHDIPLLHDSYFLKSPSSQCVQWKDSLM